MLKIECMRMCVAWFARVDSKYFLASAKLLGIWPNALYSSLYELKGDCIVSVLGFVLLVKLGEVSEV